MPSEVPLVRTSVQSWKCLFYLLYLEHEKFVDEHSIKVGLSFSHVKDRSYGMFGQRRLSTFVRTFSSPIGEITGSLLFHNRVVLCCKWNETCFGTHLGHDIKWHCGRPGIRASRCRSKRELLRDWVLFEHEYSPEHKSSQEAPFPTVYHWYRPFLGVPSFWRHTRKVFRLHRSDITRCSERRCKELKIF